MESKTTKVQASFYCNRCDKWVDGIEDEQSHKAPPGYRQALCDECGSTLMYRLPGFWHKLQHKTSDLFNRVFSSLKKVGRCKKQSDREAIHAGITYHLTTLNMGAMDTDMRTVSITGKEAHAEVEFRPKNGAPQGKGMQVAYNLEKREGTWVVLKTQPLGGMIQHPNPNQNPHQNPSMHPGALPNLTDILNPASAPAQAALAQGHPAPSAPNQTPNKKPR